MSGIREDVIDLKPNIGGIGINLNALWRWWHSKPNPLTIVPERFLKLFREHNVAVSQIPRLIPGLTLEQLSSPELLLQVLTPKHLKRAAELFGIRLAWLEGTSKVIYDIHPSYKNPWAFFEDYKTLKVDPFAFPVVGFTSAKKLDWRSDKDQPIVLVMREKCAQLGEKDIYRFRIHDQFLWGYWKSRIQLKAMMRVLYKQSEIPVRIYRVDASILKQMEEGRLIPGPYYRHGKWVRDIELEDFSLMPSESAQAKDPEELPTVLEYIEAFQLEHVGQQGVINPMCSEAAQRFTQ